MATEAQRIDGKAIAAEVVEIAKAGAAELKAAHGVVPGLATVIVGEDPASKVYVASKGRMAESCGYHSVSHTLPVETDQATLLALVADLNADPAIHGILVQLPLPAHIDERAVIRAIDPAKDVDGFHVENTGRLATGDLDTAFVPCTPAGVMILLARTVGTDLSGRHAVVVGRSNIVGKPVAALLLAANATVTIAHSRTADLASLCRGADILIAAVGRPKMMGADFIKPGAVVIDVGTNRLPAPERGEGRTRLVGDVDYDAALPIAAAITPVPGGVGPMTIALLMANTLTAACRSVGATPPSFAAGA
ncbi:MAG: bifunctional methylenetetrahydrofolate dehydrogenase/methenyltetrahydrofolate cyclohydrolase FolD [Acuticoccus sp.]